MKRFMITSESELPIEPYDPAFVVLDVTDPRKISFVDRIRTLGTTVSFASHNGLLFCSEIGHLEIFDVSSLPKISRVSMFEGNHPGNTTLYEVSEKRLYLSSYQHGISVIDVKNPTSPVLLGSCDCDISVEPTATYGPYGISQIEKKGSFVYGVAMDYSMTKGREALYVYDVGDVGNIEKAARLSTTPVRGHGMAIVGSHLFAVGACGILSIDISSPEEPLTIGELPLEGRFGVFARDYRNRLLISGRILEFAEEESYAKADSKLSSKPLLSSDRSQNGFFQVIDVSNPIHPRLLSETRIDTGEGFGLLVDKDTAYLACSNGVATVDVKDVNNPTVLAFFDELDQTKEYIGVATVEAD
ncbi:LVIVD repeat-containing protein [Mesotoga sp. BH458_6_3_2_1]|uniref:LVIVD repeat-containing protein n=1 Tax=Mesotoga sp. BH458_6_3_2_1 TaxID=1437446 RepID=UPI00217EF00C|nr:hypothetical protein [Mesotoga sp. BH458_6_3_2_1]